MRPTRREPGNPGVRPSGHPDSYLRGAESVQTGRSPGVVSTLDSQSSELFLLTVGELGAAKPGGDCREDVMDGGWNSQAHREIPGNVESRKLSLAILSMETGRNDGRW